MSTYKYLDNDGLLYVKGKLDTKFATKVDKETGKGLSANDYTTTEKNKLSNIESGAQVNVIETVEVNGTALTPSNKAVDITVPTNTNELTNGAGFITSSALPTKVSDLTNDAGYTTNEGTVTSIATTAPITGGTITGSGTIGHSTAAGYKHIPTGGSTNQYLKYGGSSGTASWASPATTVNSSSDDTTIPTSKAVMTAITNAVGGITGVAFEIVTTLPQTGAAGTIYLISNSGSSPNIYDEYIYVSDSWEKIGTTDVDLSGYVQATELVAITNAEIDTIFA